MCSITGLGERLHKDWCRLDPNSGFHGNRKCPLTYNGENDVFMLTPSVLIRSLSNLRVSRIAIKYLISSNFGKFVSLRTELGALEHLKFSNRLEPGHVKMCIMSYAKNKGANQPAHPRSPISAFVVHS